MLHTYLGVDYEQLASISLEFVSQFLIRDIKWKNLLAKLLKAVCHTLEIHYYWYLRKVIDCKWIVPLTRCLILGDCRIHLNLQEKNWTVLL